ncbi:LysR family transcriptional regulator [Azospirillum sp. YIM DDC1]|uniref:LysR family transcriptional regulator n=1 Tax=Azospirillum aestuarii TaxID=2802052 RepID=A0ABS1I7G4_9PROT|nr:LysR family transcriptional regulator [Azospirillum aestuarii]MBK4723010.1 LysR family transcriptional regulator [Azospirillum aestuarii]
MDRLEAMGFLLAALDVGSFSAATRRLGIPAATLTRKIDQLEQHMGATLLIRTTRKLALTDAGQRYAEGARRIVAEVRDMEREAAGEFIEPTGRLVVSAPRMFGRLYVQPVIHDFLRLHDAISVELQLSDGNVDLAAGAADLAVRIGALPDSSLIATRLGSMRTVNVASPAFLDSHPFPRHPDDLAGLPAILLDIPQPDKGPRHGGHGQVHDRTRLIVSGAEAAVDAAVAGVGVVRLLHYQAAQALKEGRLRLLLENFESEPAPVHVLHAPLVQLPQKTRHFIDFAASRLRASLLALGQDERGYGFAVADQG